MSEIGVREARARLPQLLKRVEAGERFVITRHERPVAELIPYRGVDRDQVRTAIESLREFRESHSLGGLAIRELIGEGRRY
ncbi:MAG: type II toxin-antitoxin system prevent-host-death family antitoxin [Acidobacteria bacterium]|nr:type II toxin-antitoxin system prevent-host-death family antitoxin [Acidobacteriota bacterium]